MINCIGSRSMNEHTGQIYFVSKVCLFRELKPVISGLDRILIEKNNESKNLIYSSDISVKFEIILEGISNRRISVI